MLYNRVGTSSEPIWPGSNESKLSMVFELIHLKAQYQGLVHATSYASNHIDAFAPASDLSTESQALVSPWRTGGRRLLECHFNPSAMVSSTSEYPDRQGHDRFGKTIIEEQTIIPPSMKKKPLHAKQMVQSVPLDDETDPSPQQLINPSHDPSSEYRPMSLRRLRRRRQRWFVRPYEMTILREE
ncbi:hypothetical protein V6N13_020279 [Hibiscus sabdariffa]